MTRNFKEFWITLGERILILEGLRVSVNCAGHIPEEGGQIIVFVEKADPKGKYSVRGFRNVFFSEIEAAKHPDILAKIILIDLVRQVQETH